MQFYHQWSKRRRSTGATLHCGLHCLISTGPGDTSRSHRANHGRVTVLRSERRNHTHAHAHTEQRLHGEEERRRRGGRLRSSPHSSVTVLRRLDLPRAPTILRGGARLYNTSLARSAAENSRTRMPVRGGRQLEGRSEKRARLSVLFPVGCKECEGEEDQQHQHHSPPVSLDRTRFTGE